MKPTTIHLVFENCDQVEIPAVFVKQLRINSIQGSSVWYSVCNSKEGHYCESQYTSDLLIRLDYEKCLQEVKTTRYGDYLERLFKYNDITYIDLSFEDESLYVDKSPNRITTTGIKAFSAKAEQNSKFEIQMTI